MYRTTTYSKYHEDLDRMGRFHAHLSHVERSGAFSEAGSAWHGFDAGVGHYHADPDDYQLVGGLVRQPWRNREVVASRNSFNGNVCDGGDLVGEMDRLGLGNDRNLKSCWHQKNQRFGPFG